MQNQNAIDNSSCSRENVGIIIEFTTLRRLAEWYLLATQKHGGNACQRQEAQFPPAVNSGDCDDQAARVVEPTAQGATAVGDGRLSEDVAASTRIDTIQLGGGR
jgi:hypothetical protein